MAFFFAGVNVDRDLLPRITRGYIEASDVEASPSVLPTGDAGSTLRKLETPFTGMERRFSRQPIPRVTRKDCVRRKLGISVH